MAQQSLGEKVNILFMGPFFVPVRKRVLTGAHTGTDRDSHPLKTQMNVSIVSMQGEMFASQKDLRQGFFNSMQPQCTARGFI